MAKLIHFKTGNKEQILNLDSLHNAVSYMSQAYEEDEVTPKGAPYRVLTLYFGPTHGGFVDGKGEFECDNMNLYRDEAEVVWQYLCESAINLTSIEELAFHNHKRKFDANPS